MARVGVVEVEGIDHDELVDPEPFSPYEFRTTDGTWVRLHDMRWVSFDLDVVARALTLRFVYHDATWTPPEALATPVAVFRIDDVDDLSVAWEDDDAAVPREFRGQVSIFDLHPARGLFTLSTIETRLTFRARRLRVEMTPITSALG